MTSDGEGTTERSQDASTILTVIDTFRRAGYVPNCICHRWRLTPRIMLPDGGYSTITDTKDRVSSTLMQQQGTSQSDNDGGGLVYSHAWHYDYVFVTAPHASLACLRSS